MAEYILRDQAIIAVTGAKLPDVSASGLPIANGKRSVTDCVRRLKDIPAADVRPVVTCADCKHNNACLTQAFVEEESRVPFDRSTFFCADGERMKRNANN